MCFMQSCWLLIIKRDHYGNASLESSFSANKELRIKNMKEETIVTQRVVFDAIWLADIDKTKIDISKKMMADVRHSHDAYKSALQRKKDKQSEGEKLTSLDRKRKSMIASLEQQQKEQKLAEMMNWMLKLHQLTLK